MATKRKTTKNKTTQAKKPRKKTITKVVKTPVISPSGLEDYEFDVCLGNDCLFETVKEKKNIVKTVVEKIWARIKDLISKF